MSAIAHAPVPRRPLSPMLNGHSTHNARSWEFGCQTFKLHSRGARYRARKLTYSAHLLNLEGVNIVRDKFANVVLNGNSTTLQQQAPERTSGLTHGQVPRGRSRALEDMRWLEYI
jgi:hypothetical protein